MKLTPMDIREHLFKKKPMGYSVSEVNAFKELAAATLEEAIKQVNRLEEQVRDLERRLSSHEAREEILKEAITSAQKMGGDLKETARKEAELIISDANIQAEELTRNAHKRVVHIQSEIYELKKQRLEIQNSIKSILEYHGNLLTLEENESEKGDEADDKLKFIHT